MADSSSSLLPLSERISHKSYILRAVDLTILSLLFSLLFYRILHISQNDNVWISAFICESCFLVVWLIFTFIKWSPAEDIPYPNRLDERVHDLPSVDMFMPTSDPVRESPIIVVNTLLSLLSVNYPANKLACYVSDDGCSPLIYFSLKEASKFAMIWVPFCKKYNVGVRAPFRYFLQPLVATDDSEFSKNWKMTKMEYEKLCRKIEDATEDCQYWLDADDDFKAFSNTKPNDHSAIVKVVWENKGGVGDDKEVPHLLYISREKRPNYFHHYKTGAMNFLLRVSGLMTNAPYTLNVDCDMYVNEPDVIRQAMCVFLQNSKNSNRCAFVQFPQEFYDSYTDQFSVLQSYLGRGVAGIQGPIYYGTGCFHTRKVMYGLSSDDLEDNGSLSPVATREFLAEDSLVRKYGNSKELVKSVVDALQNKSNPQKSLTNFIEAAQEVGHCHYENQTSWGNLGWLYDSVAEDVNTSIGIHSRGWTSSFISPDPPAFLGSTPSGGIETIIQQQRWATGAIEILFNKQSPLVGMFHRKIMFRQRLGYLWALMCIRSIPELVYCLLPAYCLLHNSALFPKGPCLGIIVTLVGMHCLYSLWQFMSLGFSVQSWYVSQSLWRIIATSSWLFSIQDIILKLLGISGIGSWSKVAKKSMPETRSLYESNPSQGEDDGPKPNLGKFEFDSSYHFIPGTFIMLVNLAALASVLVGLQRSSCSHGGDGSGFPEACGCILVVMLFIPFLKGLFEHGKYGIPLSTLSKAAFLTVLFVVFSLGK